jgi:hypothetical protein
MARANFGDLVLAEGVRDHGERPLRRPANGGLGSQADAGDPMPSTMGHPAPMRL